MAVFTHKGNIIGGNALFPDLNNLIDTITLQDNVQGEFTTLQQDSFIVWDIYSIANVQGYLQADGVNIFIGYKTASDFGGSCILPKGTVLYGRNRGGEGYIKIYGLKC